MSETYRLELDDGRVVAERVAVASSMWSRFCGLMMRKDLSAGDGLCIKPCNSIHMFFMRIAIDVVFVDRDGKALHILHSIKPWRMSRIVGKSAAAIELRAGTLLAAGVKKGDRLKMV